MVLPEMGEGEERRGDREETEKRRVEGETSATA